MDSALLEWNRVRQFSHRSREWRTYDRQKYRSPFGGDGRPVPVSHRLPDHASADEIANVITGVAKLWRDMGEQAKAANGSSPLPKFTWAALNALPDDQQEQVLAGECLKDNRSHVRQVLRELKDGFIPSSFHPRYPYFTGELGRLLTEIHDRYRTAYRAVLQRHKDEWKPPPVDDAAWEETLRQRARSLAYGVAETQIRQERGRPSYVDHELINKRAAQLQAAYGERFTAAVPTLVDCQCGYCRHGDGYSAYCREDVRIRDEFAAQMNAQPEARFSGKTVNPPCSLAQSKVGKPSAPQAKRRNPMDVSRYFAGVFLKVEDLEATGPMKAKIVDVSMGRYDKPDLTFDDGNKLSVNATNGRVLARAYGYETNDWVNKEVELTVGEVQYQGKPQASILIKPISPPDKNKAPPTKRADDMDDSIPF